MRTVSSIGFFIVAFSVLGWTQCKQFVHYDGRQFSVTEGKFPHVSLGGLNTERKQVQAAAALTQQLDILQFNNCTAVRTLPRDTEEYSRAIVGMIQANQQLMQQLVVLQAYAANKSDQNKDELIKESSAALAKSGQFQSTSDAYAEKLMAIAPQIPGAPQALFEVSLRQREPIRDTLKKLYSDEDHRVIREQLSKMVGAMVKRTGAKESDFEAYVFVPGGDGNLYVPPGMVLDPRDPSHTDSKMRIPYWYGVVGVVFEDNRTRPACVDLSSRVQFSPGQEGPETDKARMLLLPPPYNVVHEKFILGVPITDAEDLRIGVLTLSVYPSAATVANEDDLCRAYSAIPSDSQEINDAIADRLKYPGRPPDKNANSAKQAKD